MNRILRKDLRPRVPFPDFIAGSIFYDSYVKANSTGVAHCLPRVCPHVVKKKDDFNYDLHISTKHSNDYDLLMEKYVKCFLCSFWNVY